MGLITSLIAAVIPARSAAARGSGEGSAKGQVPVARAKARAARGGTGPSACACRRPAVRCSDSAASASCSTRVILLAVLAAVLLSPALSLWLSRVLRPVLAWVRPVEGTLAADSLIQAPRRTSGTVAALMLSLALVISLGGLARASYNSIADWMHIALNPDLFVTTAENITERSFVFPASLGEGLRADRRRGGGATGAQRARAGERHADHAGRGRCGRAGAPRQVARRWKATPETMYRVTAEGKGVMASENFARLHGAHLGEMLEIPAPSGILRLPIVGIVRDFSDQQGSILMSRDVFMRAWNGRFGQRFPHLPEARRGRSASAAENPGHLWIAAAAVRAHQRRSARLHHAPDGSVVRTDLRADRRGGVGGRAGNRERADGFDHGPPARTGRAASGGRIAPADSAYHLDGGRGDRRDQAWYWV